MRRWIACLALATACEGQRRCIASRCTRGPTLLQLRSVRRRGAVQLENEDGNCLEASNAANGVWPSMEPCDADNPLQRWEYDSTSGLLRHNSGHCLDASQRDVRNGRIHLWDCDPLNKNQMWDLLESSQLKNRYGLCMDAPHPTIPHSHVHMWDCRTDLSNQRWHLGNAGSTTETTTEAVSSTESSSSSSSSFSSVTTTTTPKPLSAVRNCQLEPLVEGAGCQRLASFEGEAFDLAENSQETLGRHRCLLKLREVGGDSFVHRLGLCEVWRCGTVARLKLSAGPGGALSPSLDAITLAAQGRYLTVQEGGKMAAVEESFVPEAVFHLKEVEQGKFTLKAANELYVKATPAGRLVAETSHWDDWEVFDLTESDGLVTLRSFHGTYISLADGHVSAGTTATAWTLQNRSQAAWEETHGVEQMLKTVAQQSTCAWPSSVAGLRCCSDAVVSEQSYGCFSNVTFQEAQSICQQHSLTLCTEEQLKSAPSGICPSLGQIWSSSPCSASERLTQRRYNLRNDRASVFSSLCGYEARMGGRHGSELRSTVLVKLMEWNYKDIAKECTEYLAPNGFEAVQVAPVTEHILGYQWWVKYQPVSAGLDSRSGSEEDFRHMVATCRDAGVEVIVDILMNHMAGPCREAKSQGDMPCEGWGGSRFGNRRMQGARGWDAAQPEHFHHENDDVSKPFCKVGPQTGWLCPDDDCTPCDMYALPDYNTELQEVRDMQFKHLEELFHIGVTGLRVDAAIYHHVYELADMLNRLPWDLVYQEWWGEYPPQDRTDHVGLYRDVAYRWHLVNRLSGKNATELPELLDLDGGVFGISEDMAVYPFAYHDGRSKNADAEIATYKNGLAFHQQQKFFLSWHVGNTVLIWGGYGWRDLSHGPPGCDKSDGDRCQPMDVYSDGMPQCMETPCESPLPRHLARRRSWVCEHRWRGVAGLIHFRKACRGQPLTETWKGDKVKLGRLAFRLGGDCFVALVRGRRPEEPEDEEVVGVGGPWDLQGLAIGLPDGTYCDMSSLSTQKGWDGQSCPRHVKVSAGVILQGAVAQGELLAIHSGARALHVTE